jgi:molybdopterin converting factor small subunit
MHSGRVSMKHQSGSNSSMATRTITLFAGARDAIGSGHVDLDVPESLSIAELKIAILDRYPVLEPFVTYGRFAVGSHFVDDTSIVSNDSKELALIPPVSGG